MAFTRNHEIAPFPIAGNALGDEGWEHSMRQVSHER
jgi:hypothetical protein